MFDSVLIVCHAKAVGIFVHMRGAEIFSGVKGDQSGETVSTSTVAGIRIALGLVLEVVVITPTSHCDGLQQQRMFIYYASADGTAHQQ